MRKGLRRIVLAALAAGLIAALVMLNQSREALEARQAAERTRIENLYHRIDDDLNDVDVSLSKLSAASSPRQSVLLLGDVWRATGSAGAAMALLPHLFLFSSHSTPSSTHHICSSPRIQPHRSP